MAETMTRTQGQHQSDWWKWSPDLWTCVLRLMVDIVLRSNAMNVCRWKGLNLPKAPYLGDCSSAPIMAQLCKAPRSDLRLNMNRWPAVRSWVRLACAHGRVSAWPFGSAPDPSALPRVSSACCQRVLGAMERLLPPSPSITSRSQFAVAERAHPMRCKAEVKKAPPHLTLCVAYAITAQEMSSHQETIFGKYFAVGSKGSGGMLDLSPFAVKHTEALYSRCRGRPVGYIFDVAQAFVYQVLQRTATA